MRTAVELHPTRQVQGILQIVEGIYAAACGEMPWEQTIAEVCQVGKLDAGALTMVDPLERRRVVLASWGLSFAAEPDGLLGPMPGKPPWTDRVLRSTPGAVWQDRQIMSDLLPTIASFPTDRMQPNSLISWGCLIAARDERQVVCLEVFARAGHASSCPELGDFLRQLAPHLTRAWRLGRAHRTTAATPFSAASRSRFHADAPAPDLAALPAVVRLRAEFGLTKAEARLALRLAEGASLGSAAQAFDVKLTTIRSQLQQVFAKTGTSRQTELVAMLLSRGYGLQRFGWGLDSPMRAMGAVAG